MRIKQRKITSRGSRGRGCCKLNGWKNEEKTSRPDNKGQNITLNENRMKYKRKEKAHNIKNNIETSEND